MEIIIHRVNTIEKLKMVPHDFGCEIDVRSNGKEIILNHDAMQDGCSFENFLNFYNHGPLVVHIKESGIEDFIIKELNKHNISNYFLLDCEFPYIYKKVRENFKKLAIRFSEDEPIHQLEKYKNLVDWVWIDTNTVLPINNENAKLLSKLKSCLVCPERWNRPQDIILYKNELLKMKFECNAVMTSLKYANLWLK